MPVSTLIAVALAAAVLGAGTVAFIVLLAEAQDWRREEERPETPWGDVVEIPREAKRGPGISSGGGGTGKAGPAQVSHSHIAHDGSNM